jgi:hypothetical protein
MWRESGEQPGSGVREGGCDNAIRQGRYLIMLKVKTFMSPLKIFHTVEELASLDDQVNNFLAEQGVKRILSASDACTTDNTGAAIGVIRVIAYET